MNKNSTTNKKSHKSTKWQKIKINWIKTKEKRKIGKILTGNNIKMLINGIRKIKLKKNGIKMGLEKNGKKAALFINKLTNFQQIQNKMIPKELLKLSLKIKTWIQTQSQRKLDRTLKNNQIQKIVKINQPKQSKPKYMK